MDEGLKKTKTDEAVDETQSKDNGAANLESTDVTCKPAEKMDEEPVTDVLEKTKNDEAVDEIPSKGNEATNLESTDVTCKPVEKTEVI